MDHRISKDMISSGMIPSGEKKQEDLSRTQYGTAPSPNALADVYKKMYETKEEVINEHHKKDADGNTIPHEGEELNEAIPLIGAALAKVGAIAGKGAMAGKAAGTAAKVTTTGGKVVAGASKGTGKLAKAGEVLNKAADLSFKTQMIGSLIPKPSGVEKKKTTAGMVSADADLFDIIKGQLLDEGLSEEEIKDIMLTLTPDEILNELSVGKMANYISAADKDVQKTAASIKKDGSVMSDDTRVKKMMNRAQGMAVAGTKIAKKMSPPRMEEYKGSGTPEQQAAMKAQVEVSKKVNRYGGKTPSGTTAVDAKKGIEDVRKSM